MVKLIKTDSENIHFVNLVKLLDTDLAIKNGADHSFYAQFNKINNIKHVILAFENDLAVGCGAIKPFDQIAMEVKRMYILPTYRKNGIATIILNALEAWAKELGYIKTVLETGKRQPEAIALYQKNEYKITQNYGQYKGIENSVCFEKLLIYSH
jgi:putative acetyltransferase